MGSRNSCSWNIQSFVLINPVSHMSLWNFSSVRTRQGSLENGKKLLLVRAVYLLRSRKEQEEEKVCKLETRSATQRNLTMSYLITEKNCRVHESLSFRLVGWV